MLQQNTDDALNVDAMFTATMASVQYATTHDDDRRNVIYVTLMSDGEYTVFPLCVGAAVPLDVNDGIELRRNENGDTSLYENDEPFWMFGLPDNLKFKNCVIGIRSNRHEAVSLGKKWLRELTQN